MRLVRCINERNSVNGQIIEGHKYWIDESTLYTDFDGDEYAKVYLDENKEHFVGNLLTSHFETIYRYLLYGDSLSNYVNSNKGFLLKDIISWCLTNTNYSLSEHILLYIHDHVLNIEENMEKEFIVNSEPFKNFNDKEDYMKYMGYSLICIDN